MMRVYARNYGLAEHTDLTSTILIVAIMGGYMTGSMVPHRGPRSCGEDTHSCRCAPSPYEELGVIYDLVARQPPIPPSLSLCSHSAADGAPPLVCTGCTHFYCLLLAAYYPLYSAKRGTGGNSGLYTPRNYASIAAIAAAIAPRQEASLRGSDAVHGPVVKSFL